jgi:hypothetical protein
MTKTFLGDTPDGMVHSFVDGDKTNDNIMNIKLIKKPASISEKQKLAGEEDNHHDPRLCLDGESWMDIESVDGTYQVSDLGRIRSIDRTAVGVDGYERSHSSRVLKQSVSPDGYRNCQGYHRGKKSLFCVHLVVSRAFMGETPDGFQVDHINEKRYDPRVVNLRFLRQRDNVNRQFAGGKSHVLSEGVMFHHGSFVSKIVNKTVYCSLGSFKLESDAANAYQLAKSRIYENPDIEMTREALIG